MILPNLDDVIDRLHVVSLPMWINFRGNNFREVALINGPNGWGEFGAFLEYKPFEAIHWLISGLEAAYQVFPKINRKFIPINATIPTISVNYIPKVLTKFPEIYTTKVKVAKLGGKISDDIMRINVTQTYTPLIRLDANGGWTANQANIATSALTSNGPLEYIEQPCPSLKELNKFRSKIQVPIAIDEFIRKNKNPIDIIKSSLIDLAILKVAPLGGVSRLLNIASKISIPVIISSALDSAIGISTGLRAAASLPKLHYACGLGTSRFFIEDIASIPSPTEGYLTAEPVTPDPARLESLAVPKLRRQWWINRIHECYSYIQKT